MDERVGASSAGRVRVLIVAAITALTGMAIVAGVTGSVAPLIIVFVLLCPGLALVGPLRLRDPLFEIVLGVALSVSVAGLLATMELFLHAWAPMPTLSLLVAISIAGLLLDPELIPRRLWASAAARSAGAVSGLRRGLGRQGSSQGEPWAGETPVSLVTPASSMAVRSIASTATTASVTPSAPSPVRSTGPRTVPAMGPMLMVSRSSDAPGPAEVPTAAQPAGPSDRGSSADQSSPTEPTPAPARPVAETGRRGRSKDDGAPPPPPTIIVARRLPEELRPKPTGPARRGRPKGGVADEEPEASEPTRKLRSAVRDVVGDLADHKDGKR
jgi:hypothetical protein